MVESKLANQRQQIMFVLDDRGLSLLVEVMEELLNIIVVAGPQLKGRSLWRRGENLSLVQNIRLLDVLLFLLFIVSDTPKREKTYLSVSSEWKV